MAAALSGTGALDGHCPATLPTSISMRAISTQLHRPAPAESSTLGSAVAFLGVGASRATAGEQQLQPTGGRVTSFVS